MTAEQLAAVRSTYTRAEQIATPGGVAADGPLQIPNATNIGTISADEANAPFVTRGWSPPYASGTNVTTFTAGEDMQFARVSGADNQQGAFLVKQEDIAGMNGEQIQQTLALPYKPTFISDVNVPAGTNLQMGQVGAQPSFGAPSPTGVQYQLLSQIPPSSFTNFRPLR
jgi:filamentous hemagglutinin